MSAYSLSRQERLYLQKQPTFGLIPGGNLSVPTTATVAGSNACRFTRMRLQNETAVLVRPDKTGSRSQTVGIRGRSFGRWSMDMALAASGTAGTVPDCDPLLVGLFGKDASVSAGVSCTYALDDAIPLTTLWSFRQPSTLDQRVLHSAVVQEATFNLGQDVATWTCQGEGSWVLTSGYFGSADATQKAGLSAFPTEPGSPTTNGGIIAGFTGQVTIGGNVIAVVRTASLRIQTQNMMVKDTFGTYYPNLTEGGERTVQTSFSLYDSDDASTEAIKELAYTKQAATIVYQVGTVAGSIWTFTLQNVQMSMFDLNDQGLRFTVDMSESRSYASSLTALDELSLVIT